MAVNSRGCSIQHLGGALRACAAISLSLGFFCSGASAAQSPAQSAFPLLTNLQQVVTLSDDALRDGQHEARVQAVITYIPQQRNRIYVQDGTNASYADFTNTVSGCNPGDLVELAGPVKRGYLVPRIVTTEWRVLGQAPLPE